MTEGWDYMQKLVSTKHDKTMCRVHGRRASASQLISYRVRFPDMSVYSGTFHWSTHSNQVLV